MVLMSLVIGQQWRNRHREQTYGHGVGEEGEGEMYGKSNMETYNAMCGHREPVGICSMTWGT